jgi:hypothetical protein
VIRVQHYTKRLHCVHSTLKAMRAHRNGCYIGGRIEKEGTIHVVGRREGRLSRRELEREQRRACKVPNCEPTTGGDNGKTIGACRF